MRQGSTGDCWEFYLDHSSEWRWKRVAVNGEEVGASTEGYKSRYDCEENAKRNGWRKRGGGSRSPGGEE